MVSDCFIVPLLGLVTRILPLIALSQSFSGFYSFDTPISLFWQRQQAVFGCYYELLFSSEVLMLFQFLDIDPFVDLLTETFLQYHFALLRQSLRTIIKAQLSVDDSQNGLFLGFSLKRDSSVE